MVPRLGSIEEAGFEKFTFFFFADEGVRPSRELPASLMGCEKSKYRCLEVDADVIGVLPREVAQAVMVPTTLESSELGRECGQGAASG